MSKKNKKPVILPNKKANFEAFLPTIDAEILKRKNKWNLNSLPWIDFDDVSQIIRIHIYKKWYQYNPERPIRPWLNAIISNQIRNLIRNNYSNFSRPCLRCDAANDYTSCNIYNEDISDCPLYKEWQRRKQHAHNIKIPVSIENHMAEIRDKPDESFDLSLPIERMHVKMKEILKPIEYKVYEGLFILHQEEAKVAARLGYITNEDGRTPGYRQMKNIIKIILKKARKCLFDGEIDI